MKLGSFLGTLLGGVVAAGLWAGSIQLAGNEIAFILWVMAAIIGLATQWCDGRSIANGAFSACVLAASFLVGRYFAAKLALPDVLRSLAAEGKLPVQDGASPSETVQAILASHGHQLALNSTWVPIAWPTLMFLLTGTAVAYSASRGSIIDEVSLRIDRWQALKILEREANARAKPRKLHI